MTEPNHPHDALFKKTFSVPEHAAGELRAVLPPALVALTDFSTLSLCAGTYIDETLAGAESDLLFSVQVASKPALLYLLFEHQSTAPRLMPLRLLSYVVRILQRHVDDAHAAQRDPLPLPLVLPVVLHHGEQGWASARRMEELFDLQLVREACVDELIPRLSFVLDDLSKVSDAELGTRALGLVPLLTLWALRDARSPERLVQSVGHWAAALGQLLAAPNGREALWTLFRYIAVVSDDSVTTTLAQALETTQPQVKDALMTIAEKWIAEGEAKGRVEGRVEGKADILGKQLTLKFGSTPDEAVRRITGASEADLDRWLERVLTAATIDAVLNG